jgi:hypothetical protein
MGIKIFNGLPLELKSIENFKVFKKKLKKFYLICNESDYFVLLIFFSHLSCVFVCQVKSECVRGQESWGGVS